MGPRGCRSHWATRRAVSELAWQVLMLGSQCRDRSILAEATSLLRQVATYRQEPLAQWRLCYARALLEPGADAAELIGSARRGRWPEALALSLAAQAGSAASGPHQEEISQLWAGLGALPMLVGSNARSSAELRRQLIALLLAQGLTNREIAYVARCSVKTVEREVTLLLHRHRLGSRAEWVARSATLNTLSPVVSEGSTCCR
jgi:DNA-binding CsgD family transcriptional regulator